MTLSRREFVKSLAVLVPAALPESRVCGSVDRSSLIGEDAMGVLVDIPNCVGCRKCEFACQESAGIPGPPIDAFEDKSVFRTRRRPGTTSLTVVNEYPNPKDETQPVYVKSNCLHCQDPACVSACLVGALQKDGNGAVVYDAWKCMGCRYCMIACPFQIPAYEFDNAFTPRVVKCSFCFERIRTNGGVPACVKICPRECLTFGRRRELLSMAHEKIRAQPDRYVDQVYGEHEAGGTSWLYLSSVPFEGIGLPALASVAPNQLTETLQHSVFKHWVPPILLYGLMGIIMRLTHGPLEQKESASKSGGGENGNGRDIAPHVVRADAFAKRIQTSFPRSPSSDESRATEVKV